MKKKIVIMVVFGTLAILGFAFLFMSLWNWLIPDLFKGPELTYLQAGGLLILAKILIGGFKGKCGGHCNSNGDNWRGKMSWKNKCKSMTPEQKDKLKKCFEDKFEDQFEDQVSDSPEKKSMG